MEQRLKGCFMIMLSFLMLGVLSLLVQFSYLLPDTIRYILVPIIVAFFFASFIASRIYGFTMKRYKVLAPDQPYEYKKMAMITYTKDDKKFVGNSARI